ncbi:centrosomal protein of 55 kDa-like [Eucyclogobius newberryi]|uniref:centrosomal protein of 55 kDa-like n=1 Tax=Eucyclogobius newberryi TaxID=166745 RepID=UPI003B5A2F44
MAAARAGIVNGKLKRQNAFLLKTLNEQTRSHMDHNRIIEKLLAHQPSSPEFEAEGTNCMPLLMPKEPSDGVNIRLLLCFASEIDKIKHELVSIQNLESSAEKKQECNVDVQAIITKLQNQLIDALEKNKQWMDYDQQREAYVKSIISTMLWMEKRLDEVREAQVELLSDEKKKNKLVERLYEGLMQKSSKKVDVLKKRVHLLQRECREKQCEVDQLRQHLQCDKDAQNSDLHVKLDKERHKSATSERQSGLQKFFINLHHRTRRQMAKFRRRMWIFDEREKNGLYLEEQLEVVQRQTEEEEGTEQADHTDQNRAHRSDPPPKTRSSPYKSLMDDSFIECPMCHAIYPTSQYKKLIGHLDYSQN